MNRSDAELETLRSVSCAVLLEQLPPPWALDRRESTRRCLKYRRGAGEVLIVNHDGRGWWDPQSERKGDVFDLVQHLQPGLHFGQVRRVLLRFVGIAPAYPAVLHEKAKAPRLPVAEQWTRCRQLAHGSAAWGYLTGQRHLPGFVLAAAERADAVREGAYGSAWFAHRDHAGVLTGIEMRGSNYRSFSAGGDKTLFRLPGGGGVLPRLAVCEAPIDALSLAALERVRPDTLYLATAGGMGPATVQALQALLGELPGAPGAVLVAATDADCAGDRYAARLATMAAKAGVGSERPLPPDGLNDWNDVLVRPEAVRACTNR